MTLFRRKFCSALAEELSQHRLTLPKQMNAKQLQPLLNKLRYQKKWHVKVQDKYDYGRGVAKYLARYVRGGPVENQQLSQNQDGRIHLSYQSHRTHKQAVQRFSGIGFIHQLLIHVPEKGCHVVRYLGLYANAKSKKLTQARVLHKQTEAEEPKVLSWQDFISALQKQGENKGDKSQLSAQHCPVCGCSLCIGETLERRKRVKTNNIMAA